MRFGSNSSANQPAPGSAQHAIFFDDRDYIEPRMTRPVGGTPGAGRVKASPPSVDNPRRASIVSGAQSRSAESFSPPRRGREDSVGPSPAQYALASGFGRQSDHAAWIQSRRCASRARRDGWCARSTPAELDSIGPAVYEAEIKMFGPQLLSGRATAPKHAFIMASFAPPIARRRIPRDSTGSVPGPGAYAPAGIGDQLLSTVATCPSYRSARVTEGRRLGRVSGSSRRRRRWADSVGPGPAYNPAPGAVDAQVHLSGKANAPKVGFPISPRDAGVRADDDEPGPGSYVV